MRLCCVCSSGVSRVSKLLPAGVGLQLRAPPLALGEGLISPQLHDRAEVADVDGERADEMAEDALLDRGALLGIEPDHLGQLSGVDVVRALLDDHLHMPPMHRYLISSHSSIP